MLTGRDSESKRLTPLVGAQPTLSVVTGSVLLWPGHRTPVPPSHPQWWKRVGPGETSGVKRRGVVRREGLESLLGCHWGRTSFSSGGSGGHGVGVVPPCLVVDVTDGGFHGKRGTDREDPRPQVRRGRRGPDDPSPGPTTPPQSGSRTGVPHPNPSTLLPEKEVGATRTDPLGVPPAPRPPPRLSGSDRSRDGRSGDGGGDVGRGLDAPGRSVET